MKTQKITCRVISGTLRNKSIEVELGPTGAETKIWCEGSRMNNVQRLKLEVTASGLAKLTLVLLPGVDE